MNTVSPTAGHAAPILYPPASVRRRAAETGTDVFTDDELATVDRVGRAFILFTIYATPPLALTVPRVSSAAASFDTADAAKLLTLVVLSALAFYYLLHRWYAGKRFAATWVIAPMVGYATYGLVSASWSALPLVSIDKAGSLGLLCVLSMAISTTIRTQRDVSRMLFHLTVSLAMLCGFIAAFFLYDPTATGLDRLRIHTGGDGLIHPTASGSTASLGLLLLLICHRVWRFDWVRRVAWPVIAIEGLILAVSNSRMSILMLVVAALPWIWRHFSPRRLSSVAIGVAAVFVLIIVFDPGLIGIGVPAAEFQRYVTRNQNAAELAAASGRMEMWIAVWNEFLKAPLLGHGYFVTSETGQLTVWFNTANHLAHNMVLQALSTTGLVGATLFGFGMTVIVRHVIRMCRRPTGGSMSMPADWDDRRRRGWTAATLLLWYAGWSLLAASFLGPLRPESLVFFSMVGLISRPMPPPAINPANETIPA